MRFGILGPLDLRTDDGTTSTPAAPARAPCSPSCCSTRAAASPWDA
ncbi:hypothetical protein [Streptomyces sp. NPDC014995]